MVDTGHWQWCSAAIITESGTTAQCRTSPLLIHCYKNIIAKLKNIVSTQNRDSSAESGDVVVVLLYYTPTTYHLRLTLGARSNTTSAVKQSIGFTIGFHNHGEGPY